MPREDNELLLLLGLWALATGFEIGPRVVKSVERGGARLFEATHSDPSHADDLPGRQLTRAQLLKIATDANFEDPRMAVAIALAESGGVPHAIGDGGTSFGLWQIHIPAHPEFSRDYLMNPYSNAAAAWKISRGGTNWHPWSTFKTGAYRRYL